MSTMYNEYILQITISTRYVDQLVLGNSHISNFKLMDFSWNFTKCQVYVEDEMHQLYCSKNNALMRIIDRDCAMQWNLDPAIS